MKTKALRCLVCKKEPFKYTCPSCGIIYCSLQCYKDHKPTCKSNESTKNSSHIPLPRQEEPEENSISLASLQWPTDAPASLWTDPLQALDPKPLKMEQLETFAVDPAVRNLLKEDGLCTLLARVNSLQPKERKQAIERLLGLDVATAEGRNIVLPKELGPVGPQERELFRSLAFRIEVAAGNVDDVLGLGPEEDGQLVQLLLWPHNSCMINCIFVMAISARIEFLAAEEFDGDNVEGRVPVDATRLCVDESAMDYRDGTCAHSPQYSRLSIPPIRSGKRMKLLQLRPQSRHISDSTIRTNSQRREPTKPVEDVHSIVKPENEVTYNFNRRSELFEDFANLTGELSPAELVRKRVTATDIARRHKTQPKEVAMLVRDFIDDALYNPSIKNMDAFERHVGESYQAEYSEKDKTSPLQRQVWHTPTELFKPWYARALARYIVKEYQVNYYPYEDLVIYEVGAGNGTLCSNILDYLRDQEPEIYSRTRYTIIEISNQLARAQKETMAGKGHGDRVIVENCSIFDWSNQERHPCFFLALEVLDNLAHDMVRFSAATADPYQSIVSIDKDNNMNFFYEPAKDKSISRWLSLSKEGPGKWLLSPTLRRLRSWMPFSANLSPPIWIPTKQLQLLDKLKHCFPNHRLIAADFDRLPESVAGKNGPVVQARLHGEMTPVTTILVYQGYFDIFFPTDFEALKVLYSRIMAGPNPSSGIFFNSMTPGLKLQPKRRGTVYTHAEFMKKYAELDQTKLLNGKNPMLEYYQNHKFFVS